MKLTERQAEILNSVIQEYISSAWPVSSQLLEKKYDFGICPATIRFEMQRLTDRGFLSQPHTSAGRIPTDKAYNFFINGLFENDFFKIKREGRSELKNWLEKETEGEIEDSFKFISLITKNIALVSSDLTLSYLFDNEMLWKEGWENLLREPEFKERKCISNFTELLKDFEENVSELKINSEIKIYIGKNPFSKTRDFSIIVSNCSFPKNQKGILAILGPKRMDYDKNIGLVNFVVKSLEDH